MLLRRANIKKRKKRNPVKYKPQSHPPKPHMESWKEGRQNKQVKHLDFSSTFESFKVVSIGHSRVFMFLMLFLFHWIIFQLYLLILHTLWLFVLLREWVTKELHLEGERM